MGLPPSDAPKDTKDSKDRDLTSTLNIAALRSVPDFVTEKSASDTSNSAIPYLKPTNKESYISHPVFTSLNQTGFFGNYFISLFKINSFCFFTERVSVLRY